MTSQPHRMCRGWFCVGAAFAFSLITTSAAPFNKPHLRTSSQAADVISTTDDVAAVDRSNRKFQVLSQRLASNKRASGDDELLTPLRTILTTLSACVGVLFLVTCGFYAKRETNPATWIDLRPAEVTDMTSLLYFVTYTVVLKLVKARRWMHGTESATARRASPLAEECYELDDVTDDAARAAGDASSTAVSGVEKT